MALRARNRAGFDARTFDAHEHFGACTHEPVRPELQIEFERRRVHFLELGEQARRCAGVQSIEPSRQHDLEDIAHAHALARRIDHRPVLFGRKVAGDFGLFGWFDIAALGNGCVAAARGPRRRLAPPREFVVVAERRLFAAVDDVHAVGQKQMQLARILAPRMVEGDRLELEQKIVAEGAVEPEERIADPGELGHDAPQRRKQRRLQAALLFRKRPRGGRDLEHAQPRRFLDAGEFGEDRIEQIEQDFAARIQRPQSQTTSVADQFERRIDEAEFPARIAPRIIHARRKQPAARAVELFGETVEGGCVVERALHARDDKAGFGGEFGAHGILTKNGLRPQLGAKAAKRSVDYGNRKGKMGWLALSATKPANGRCEPRRFPWFER